MIDYLDTDYDIGTAWDEVTEYPRGFVFIFYQGGTDSFDEEEWLLFFKWKEAICRAYFHMLLSRLLVIQRR